MSHRYVQQQDFAGKTIKRVNCQAVNVLTFYFTDGTAIALETENLGSTGIPVIVACDECVQECPVGDKKEDKQEGKTSSRRGGAKRESVLRSETRQDAGQHSQPREVQTRVHNPPYARGMGNKSG